MIFFIFLVKDATLNEYFLVKNQFFILWSRKLKIMLMDYLWVNDILVLSYRNKRSISFFL
jgi:hypothetical protein